MAKKRIIIFAIAVFIMLAVYLPVLSKLQELKKEKGRLENDPAYIEKIAREKLGMARKNEIILK